MKTYKVTVNGNVYEITLEVMDKADIPAAPAAAPAPAAPTGEGTAITAPMPGTLLKVNVSAGQSVKKGDILMVLEAMKMENEILAPADGKITTVSVASGDSVETGAALCVLA